MYCIVSVSELQWTNYGAFLYKMLKTIFKTLIKNKKS